MSPKYTASTSLENWLTMKSSREITSVPCPTSFTRSLSTLSSHRYVATGELVTSGTMFYIKELDHTGSRDVSCDMAARSLTRDS